MDISKTICMCVILILCEDLINRTNIAINENNNSNGKMLQQNINISCGISFRSEPVVESVMVAVLPLQINTHIHTSNVLFNNVVGKIFFWRGHGQIMSTRKWMKRCKYSERQRERCAKCLQMCVYLKKITLIDNIDHTNAARASEFLVDFICHLVKWMTKIMALSQK